jgi:hypothetical protein
MFVLAVVLTILLLLESLPSAGAGLLRSQAGMRRLDGLTRLGLFEGRNLWLVPVLGTVHLAGSAALIAGLWVPAAGVAGAAVEAGVFGWVLSRQLRAGDRGRALGAYELFAVLAVAVLVADAVRLLQLADPAPAFAAVEVRDDFGLHEGAQIGQRELSGALHVAADGKRGAAGHQLRS